MDQVWCADWDQDQALVPVTSTANSTGNIPKQSQKEYCAIVCGFAIIFPWQEILKKNEIILNVSLMVGMFLFKQKCTIPSMLPSAVCSMNGICCRASFSRPYVDFIHLLMFIMLCGTYLFK